MQRRLRYDESERRAIALAFERDGFVVLREHFDPAAVAVWRKAFMPLLEQHLASPDRRENRGNARHYITIPFRAPFADPRFYEDADIIAICRLLVGDDMWMCQLASDTPLIGSAYQDVHRDAPPLFPELGTETPAFQLAVNFPLVDVTRANGPTEIARGTHLEPKESGFERLERGDVGLEAVEMRIGDVMIRDVRGLHRGTPNTTDSARPMIVIGYSRRWLFRPEVAVRVARSVWNELTDDQRYLLRFNPIVDDSEASVENEVYRTFAF